MARKRKRAGEKIRISAADWNSFLDTADRVLHGKINKQELHPIGPGNGIVLGKNLSGDLLPQYSVVGVNGLRAPLPDLDLPGFKQSRHVFDIVVPQTPDNVGRWGILQEPLLKNQIGRVRISGISVAKITGTAVGSEPYFLDIEDGIIETLLLKPQGSAQLIWSDDSGWSIIRIANFSTTSVTRITAILTDGNTFDDLSATSAHTAGTIAGIDGAWGGASTVYVYNPDGYKLWSGITIRAEYNQSESQWEIYSASQSKVLHGVRLNSGLTDYEKLDGDAGWVSWLEVDECP